MMVGMDANLPKPKLRWFRFSLRTLFVVVVVLSMPLSWLGWNWQIVRERRDCITTAGVSHPNEDIWICELSARYEPAPFPRNWLGDSLQTWIVVNSELGPDVYARIKHAYPEAKVVSREDPLDFDPTPMPNDHLY
jgi:hypothetical protein